MSITPIGIAGLPPTNTIPEHFKCVACHHRLSLDEVVLVSEHDLLILQPVKQDNSNHVFALLSRVTFELTDEALHEWIASADDTRD